MSSYNRVIFENTVKVRCANQHDNEQLIQLLTLNQITEQVEGINATGRGKFFEIKFKNKETYDRIISNGINCCHHDELYLAEPAYEDHKTRIRANNVPIGDSGLRIRQFIERNGYRIVHSSRYMFDERLRIESGVISFIAEKLEGWQVLPPFIKMFGRKIGLRHDEQEWERQDEAAEEPSVADDDGDEQASRPFGRERPPAPPSSAWGSRKLNVKVPETFNFGPTALPTQNPVDDDGFTLVTRGGVRSNPNQISQTIPLQNRFETEAGMQWDPYDDSGILARVADSVSDGPTKRNTGRRKKNHPNNLQPQARNRKRIAKELS